ncbi:MAG: tyrosine-type recombinase/integrase [Ethanoligenens sp.]
MRELSSYTEEEYLGALRLFLRYYENRSLETMGETEIREFLLYQINLGKANGSVNNCNSTLCFIFGAVLGRNLNCRTIPRKRDRRDFPAIMSKAEIVSFFSVIDNLRDKAMFETAYGAGLRVSEITHLRTQDIDSKQMRIFIHHGKGGKDRYTLLSEQNLALFREYWKQYRPNQPGGYLFYARGQKHDVMTTHAVQNAFNKYRKRAKLSEAFTVHTLRHCFATHLLDSGVDVCQIKELLGHTFIQTKDFYLHLGNLNKSITSPLDTLLKKRGRKPKAKNDA